MMLSSNACRFVLVLAATCNALTSAQSINLGTAGNYAILAGTTVANTPTSVITGDLGSSGTAAGVTGFGPLTIDTGGTFSKSDQISGNVYARDYLDPTALDTAVSDMVAAYDAAAGRVNGDPLRTQVGAVIFGASGFGGSGTPFTPGVYTFGAAASYPSDITFDGGADDIFIIQIVGALAPGANTNVILRNGAQAKNIYWQVFGAVSIGTGAKMEGVLLTKGAVTFGAGASLNGRVLSQTTVTLATATITAPTLTEEEPSTTSDMEADWAISFIDSSYDTDEDTISLVWSHGAASGEMDAIEFYSNGCKSTGGVEFSPGGTTGIGGLTRTSNTETSAVTVMEIDENVLTNSDIYVANADGTGVVTYCVYASVSGNGLVANFDEVVVTVTMSAFGSIDSVTFQAEPLAADETSFGGVLDIGVVAVLCPNQDLPINNGQTVKICISHNNYPVAMINEITTFDFSVVDPALTQAAFVGGDSQDFTQGPVCSNSGNVETCLFETLLAASFTLNGATTVLGSGAIDVRFVGGDAPVSRRLEISGQRHLQEDDIEVDMTFQVAPQESSATKAPASFLFLATMATFAGLVF